MRKVTFVIASPSFLIRSAFCSIIERLPPAEVVRQVPNNFMLRDTIQHFRPDYAIIDTSFLLLSSNFNVINEFPGTSSSRFIALTHEKEYKSDFATFYDVISYFDDEQSIRQKIETWVTQLSRHDQDTCISKELSRQEKKVLKLLVTGHTNKEVADKLFISAHTVMTHRKNITRKLGIKTVSGLTVYAILNKLVEMTDIQQTG